MRVVSPAAFIRLLSRKQNQGLEKNVSRNDLRFSPT